MNYFSLFFLLIGCAFAGAQTSLPFVPPIYNFPQTQYGAGMQNWQLCSCAKGNLYVANNQGLLQYDGNQWQLYPLPKKQIVRSVYVSPKSGRVYVGSFEEFGYFSFNQQNQLHYTSLKPLAGNYPFLNDEVWNIFEHQGNIYFQTFASYFVYNGSTVSVHKPSPAPFAMFSVDNKLLLQGINAGLYIADTSEQYTELIPAEKLHHSLVIAVVPHQNQWLLVTNKAGLFLFNPHTQALTPFRTNIDEQLLNLRLNKALKTHNNTLLLGSLNEGIFGINLHTGQELWQLNKANGLNNNTILGLYEDAQYNIWAALDNGISLIQPQNPLQFCNLNSDIELVSDMAWHNGSFYLASNKGIYTLKEHHTEKLPNFSNQVWFVRQVDGQLFVGHNKGVSELVGQQLVPLPQVGVGGTDLKKGIIHSKEVLIGSSYTVLSVYQRNEAGKWQPTHIVKGFFDLISKIEIDPTGNIWANHPYKGVYKLSLTNDLKAVKSLTSFDKLPTNGVLKLLKIRGKIVLTDGSQFFTYSDDHQQLMPYQPLNQQLKALTKTQNVVAVNDNLYWFITDTDYFLVYAEGGKYTVWQKIPFDELLHPANEQRAAVFVAPDGSSYFCLDGVIARYNSRASRPLHNAQLQLKTLQTYDRHTDHYIAEALTPPLSFSYTKNNLVFSFQYPDFSKEQNLLWYQLSGYDKRWNQAPADFRVSYQNLPQGKYTLHAKVTDDLGNPLSSVSIPFQITTPWYKSLWAYVGYVLLLLLCYIGITYVVFRYKIKKKERAYLREKLRKQHLLEKQEKEITTLQNQMLATELEHKSKALAEATMMNVRHNDFLQNLITELENLMHELKIPKIKSRPIVQHIKENIGAADQWQVFQENFDMIHKNFFHNLKTQYPDLTPTDLRLCVLLRLNYTTKEIATMQGVSVRGVETARYRLRKKLKLQEDDNLYDFLMQNQTP